MPLTLLKADDHSVGALVQRLYPQLGEEARLRAEVALLKANPELARPDGFRPGLVVTVPADAGLKPRPGAASDDPAATLFDVLQGAVADYRQRLSDRIDEAANDLAAQDDLLRQRDVAAAIKNDAEATVLARNLTAALRERKKSLEEQRRANEHLFGRIEKDLADLMTRLG